MDSSETLADGIDEKMQRIIAEAATPGYQARLRAREEEERQQTARRFRDARESVLRTSGIPTLFVAKVSGQLAETEALGDARAVGRGILALAGKPGCGKTIAACAWLYELASAEASYTNGGPYMEMRFKYPPPMFVTAARLSRWERYNDEKMDQLLLASRLVLDDLGSEYADTKGNFLAILDELIADRAANARPMIMTTNLDASAFKERYGERIADRIREVGQFVSLGGASLRKKP